jgi:hypothetical protein
VGAAHAAGHGGRRGVLDGHPQPIAQDGHATTADFRGNGAASAATLGRFFGSVAHARGLVRLDGTWRYRATRRPWW